METNVITSRVIFGNNVKGFECASYSLELQINYRVLVRFEEIAIYWRQSGC
jgi:hypothetical protein